MDYYRGCYIKQGFVPTNEQKMRHLNWFEGFPYYGVLLGWYKFNEGSGLIAHNYAPDGSLGGGAFPDLDVINGSGDFWTALTGFGSVQLATTLSFARKQLSAPITFNGSLYSCVGGFFRRKLDPTIGGDLLEIHVDDGGGSGFGIVVEGNESIFRFGGAAYGGISNYEFENQKWYFYFLTNPGYGYIVKPDGTLKITTGYPANNNTPYDINYLHVGVRYTNNMSDTGYYGVQGSFGDIIIYNFISLTLNEWARWYDMLRSRYNMAARSGW